MTTIAEAALPQVGAKLDKAMLKRAAVNLGQAEFLQAGGIDEMAFGIEVVEAGVGRRVLAAGKCRRNLACDRAGLWQKGVDEGRFAHSRLPDQDAGVASEKGAELFRLMKRRQFQGAVTDAAKRLKLLSRHRQPVGQIAFVENDETGDFLVFRCQQGTVDKIDRKGRFGGDDDNELIDIGRNELLPEFIGAVEEAAARFEVFDYSLIAPGSAELDLVATGKFTLLAARKAA